MGRWMQHAKATRIFERMTTTWIHMRDVLDRLDIDSILERYDAISYFEHNETKESLPSGKMALEANPVTGGWHVRDAAVSRNQTACTISEQINSEDLIKLQEEVIADLLSNGFCEHELLDSNGVLRQAFIQELRNGKELKELLDHMIGAEQVDLGDLVSSRSWKTSQELHRQLTAEIQNLASQLVSTTVIVEVYKDLTPENHSRLVELAHTVRTISHGALASGNGAPSEKSRQNLARLDEALKNVLKFWPFVVMTAQQVSKYVPADHKFDLGIIDEASQSDCTALNIMIRCKQFLVVGDDKQVSPSQVGSSTERSNELEMRLPDIQAQTPLLPSYSFFDLMTMAFPGNAILLREHFRSVPAIIQISNTLFYNFLAPLRSPTIDVPLALIHSNGVKSNKVNLKEAEDIAESVYNDMVKAADGGSDVKTIGIISMGGPEQCKELQRIVEKKIDCLRLSRGAEIVNRHKLLFGEPSQFQGDERDIIYLSGVHSTKTRKDTEPEKTSQPIHPDVNEDARKKWNVALTRAKDRMILVLSYQRSDLTNKCDIRRPILDFFHGNGNVKEKATNASTTAAETALISSLVENGYNVNVNGGCIWGGALRICVEGHNAPSNALVCIENAGESKEHWETIVDQQQSLERAGRPCLRVDYATLALNFRATVKEIVDFLKNDTQLPDPSTMPSKRHDRRGCVSDDSESTTSRAMSLVDLTVPDSDGKRKASTVSASPFKRTRLETNSERATDVVASEDSSDADDETSIWKVESNGLNDFDARHGAMKVAKPDCRKTKNELKREINEINSEICTNGMKKPELYELLKELRKDRDKQPVHRTAAEDEGGPT
jgi:AAA domain